MIRLGDRVFCVCLVDTVEVKMGESLPLSMKTGSSGIMVESWEDIILMVG